MGIIFLFLQLPIMRIHKIRPAVFVMALAAFMLVLPVLTKVRATTYPVRVGPPCDFVLDPAYMNDIRSHGTAPYTLGQNDDIQPDQCNTMAVIAATSGTVTKSSLQQYSAGDCNATPVRTEDQGSEFYQHEIIITNYDLGVKVVYYHHEDPLVAVGDQVILGDQIATMSDDGCATGDHIHFEVQNLEGRELEYSEWDYLEWSQNRRVWPAHVYSYEYESQNNLDRNLDIIGLGDQGRVHYTNGLGNGQFASKVNASGFDSSLKWFDDSWFDGSMPDHVWPMDLDMDGDDDLFGIDNGFYYYSLANGDGSYEPRVKKKAKNTFISGATQYDVSVFSPQDNWLDPDYNTRLWPADVDGDGDKDLLGINYYGKVNYIANQTYIDGSGNTVVQFSGQHQDPDALFTWADWFRRETSERVMIGDIDGDGDDDIVAISRQGRVKYALSEVDPAYPETAVFSNYYQTNNYPFPIDEAWFDNDNNQLVWLANVNDDGAKDLVGISAEGKFYYLLSDVANSGEFLSKVIRPQVVYPRSMFDYEYADLVWPMELMGPNSSLAEDFMGIGSIGRLVRSEHSYSSNLATYSAPINQTNITPYPRDSYFRY